MDNTATQQLFSQSVPTPAPTSTPIPTDMTSESSAPTESNGSVMDPNVSSENSAEGALAILDSKELEKLRDIGIYFDQINDPAKEIIPDTLKTLRMKIVALDRYFNLIKEISLKYPHSDTLDKRMKKVSSYKDIYSKKANDLSLEYKKHFQNIVNTQIILDRKKENAHIFIESLQRERERQKKLKEEAYQYLSDHDCAQVEKLIDDGLNVNANYDQIIDIHLPLRKQWDLSDYEQSTTWLSMESMLNFAIKINCEQLAVQLISKGASLQNNYRRFPLQIAIEYNRMPLVELLLKKGAPVMIEKDNQFNRLMIFETAIKSKQFNVFKMLLDYTSEQMIKQDKAAPLSLLHLAANSGNLQFVKYLIEQKGYIANTAENISGTTPLMFASRNHDVETVVYLLQHGAPVNAVNKDGNSSLIFGAKSLQVTEQLLRAGAKGDIVNNQNSDIWTYIDDDSLWGLKKIKQVELLIQAGFFPKNKQAKEENCVYHYLNRFPFSKEQSTALERVVLNVLKTDKLAYCHKQLLEQLIRNMDFENAKSVIESEQMDVKNLLSNNTIDEIVEELSTDNTQSKKFLEWKNSYRDWIEGKKQSLEFDLVHAIVKNDEAKIDSMLKNTSALNIKTQISEEKLIHIAIKYNNFTLFNYLLEKGIGIQDVSTRGTPLQYALSFENLPMLKMLLSKGVDVNIPIVSGKFSSRNYSSGYALSMPQGEASEYFLTHLPLDAKGDNSSPLLNNFYEKGRFDLAESLIEKGVSPLEKDQGGSTSLIECLIAAKENTQEANRCEILIQKGVDVNAICINSFFISAMHTALLKGHLDFFKLMLEKYNGNIELRSKTQANDEEEFRDNSRTPLLNFIKNARNFYQYSPSIVETIQLLKQKNANFHAKDKKGKGVFEYLSEVEYIQTRSLKKIIERIYPGFFSSQTLPAH
ncbi:MAG: ankyrin repeat domain-containing protein [Oligoflexia bacterium]|nr:ankyrin repeat domain-containing protein [Oligoflexia bacterium]